MSTVLIYRRWKMSHIPVSTPRHGWEDRRVVLGQPGTERSPNHSCTQGKKWFKTSVLSEDCRMCVPAILSAWAILSFKMALIYSKFMAASTGWPLRTPWSSAFELHLVSTGTIQKVMGWPPHAMSPGPWWPTENRTKDCSLVLRHHQLHRSMCTAGGAQQQLWVYFPKTYTEKQIIHLSGHSLGAMADRFH